MKQTNKLKHKVIEKKTMQKCKTFNLHKNLLFKNLHNISERNFVEFTATVNNIGPSKLLLLVTVQTVPPFSACRQ